MLTLSFFLGKPTGRRERRWDDVMSAPGTVPVCLEGPHGMADGLAARSPTPWHLPGEQREEDRFSCGLLFFWERKLAWEVGSERSTGLHGAGRGRCASGALALVPPLLATIMGIASSVQPFGTFSLLSPLLRN